MSAVRFAAVLVWGVAGVWSALAAQETEAPKASPAASQAAPPAEETPSAAPSGESASNSPIERLAQPGDDLSLPFEPKTVVDDASRRAARAWFMAGQLHDERREKEQAIAAYEKAIASDPAGIAAYRALIPRLFDDGRKDDARKLAVQAARHSLTGVEVARGLAAIMTRGRATPDSISLLQEVLNLKDRPASRLNDLMLHRDLGLYLRLDGKNDDAAASYKIVFAALTTTENPLGEEDRKELVGDPGAMFDEMGQVFLEAKQPDLAVSAFEEAAKHREARPGTHSYNLATVYRQTGQPQKALDELNQYFDAQLQTKGRLAYQLLKDLLAELNRSEELVPRLEALAAADDKNVTLHFFLADQYVALDQLDKAEAMYQETLQESKEDARGLVGLAGVYRRQNRTDVLLKLLLQAFPLVPQQGDDELLEKLNPDVRELVERFSEELKAISGDSGTMDQLVALARDQAEEGDEQAVFLRAYLLGKLSVDAKRTDDAVHFYNLAISTRNDPPGVLYREIGSHLLEVKQYSRAAEIFQAAADHPSAQLQQFRWLFQYFLTFALEFDGKTDEALATIEEALQSQPDNSTLLMQRAWIHFHAQQWDVARDLYRKIIDETTDPDSADVVLRAKFSLSAIFVHLGEMEQGEQILVDVLKDDPENTQANNDLGYLWADQNKNLDKARAMIEKALAKEPDNAAYLDSMGWVLFRLGELAEARTYLQKAADQVDTDDATILDHLADCQEKLGETDLARDNREKALKIELEKVKPDQKLVKSLRDKLPKESAERPATP